MIQLKQHIIPLSLIALLLVICHATLGYYSKFQLSAMGFLLLPFVLQIESRQPKGFRYGLGFVGLLLFYLLVPAKLLLLFAFYGALFFILESQIGQVNLLAPTLALASSPLTYYVFELFGFPIRLQLTKAAVLVLQKGGYACQAEGNLIALNGQLFSVDPVCMGLNMMLTSILAAIILMRFYSWQSARTWSLSGISVVLITTVGLVIFGNLVRILLLVLTEIGAEHPLHEGLGLGVMVLFVLVPLYGGMRRLGQRLTIEKMTIPNGKLKTSKTKISPSFSLLLFSSFILISLFVAHWTHPQRTIEQLDKHTTTIEIEGYEKDIFNFNDRIEVLRFTSERAIIYIKNQDPFRLTNHNPLICWRGSGYEFKGENLLEVGEQQVYTATLQKGQQVLYTAWWLDNGTHQTTGSFGWRWRALQTQQPYRMVNVTSSDFSTLYMEITRLLD